MELVQPALPPGPGGHHPASLYAGDHAEIVSRTAKMRKLIAAGDGTAELGYGDAGYPELTLRQAKDAVCAVRNTTRQQDFRPFPDIFDRHLQDRVSAADLLMPNRQLWLTRDTPVQSQDWPARRGVAVQISTLAVRPAQSPGSCSRNPRRSSWAGRNWALSQGRFPPLAGRRACKGTGFSPAGPQCRDSPGLTGHWEE